MIDYRNILRLHSEGHSQRAMERELYCSRHTISDVLDKAKKAGISWPLGEDVTNEMIQELLFPGKSNLRACNTILRTTAKKISNNHNENVCSLTLMT